MLLANHGALTVGGDLFGAYYKMETIEHFAKISLVARLLGREHLISREEVNRLQELRGSYGIKAPAPICPDPAIASAPGSSAGMADGGSVCQVVQAPSSPGSRLVPDVVRYVAGGGSILPVRDVRAGDDETAAKPSQKTGDAEIRLTYRELSALIEDAIRSLR